VVNMTLSIPDELKKQMGEMKFINWSEVAREAFRKQIDEYALFKKIVNKSKLTQKDVDELSKKVNNSAGKRFRDEVKALKK
jgi:Arc/MetJ-type ribon-helix-helix transcriptional regulator